MENKKYLLRYKTYNRYRWCWEQSKKYFNTKEEMIDFIKNGNQYTKPEDIKNVEAFELIKLNIEK